MAKDVDPCEGADGVGKDGMEKFCPPAAPAFELPEAAGGVDEAEGLGVAEAFGAAEPADAGGVIGTAVAGAESPEAGALPPL